VDSTTGDAFPILYNAALTVLPPEFAGTGELRENAGLGARRDSVLRTMTASPGLHTEFVAGHRNEHELVRHMLGSGYSTLVVLPGTVAGWWNGRVHKVLMLEDKTGM
jgi:hypothetical protein